MLTNQPCVAVEAGAVPMTEGNAKSLLGQVEGWALAQGGKAIFRKYTFPDFDGALACAQRIAALAQAENHHPDISFGWGYVKLRLMTHSLKGLHKNDFILATKINALMGNGLAGE